MCALATVATGTRPEKHRKSHVEGVEQGEEGILDNEHMGVEQVFPNSVSYRVPVVSRIRGLFAGFVGDVLEFSGGVRRLHAVSGVSGDLWWCYAIS